MRETASILGILGETGSHRDYTGGYWGHAGIDREQLGDTGLILGVIGTILGATGRTGNTLHENGRNWEQLGPCGGGGGQIPS